MIMFLSVDVGHDVNSIQVSGVQLHRFLQVWLGLANNQHISTYGCQSVNQVFFLLHSRRLCSFFLFFPSAVSTFCECVSLVCVCFITIYYITGGEKWGRVCTKKNSSQNSPTFLIPIMTTSPCQLLFSYTHN